MNIRRVLLWVVLSAVVAPPVLHSIYTAYLTVRYPYPVSFFERLKIDLPQVFLVWALTAFCAVAVFNAVASVKPNFDRWISLVVLSLLAIVTVEWVLFVYTNSLPYDDNRDWQVMAFLGVVVPRLLPALRPGQLYGQPRPN